MDFIISVYALWDYFIENEVDTMLRDALDCFQLVSSKSKTEIW